MVSSVFKKNSGKSVSSGKGKLFVITGASGAGKTSVATGLLASIGFLKRVVTCTTRAPREGERDGVDYHFFSREKFEDLLKKDSFLEHADVYGNYYGSLKSEVNELMDSGKSVLLTVDVQGAQTIKKKFPKAVTIFITVPSLDVLKQRLLKRGKDSMGVINKRLGEAEAEIKHQWEFDYILVSGLLADDIEMAKDIIYTELGTPIDQRI